MCGLCETGYIAVPTNEVFLPRFKPDLQPSNVIDVPDCPWPVVYIQRVLARSLSVSLSLSLVLLTCLQSQGDLYCVALPSLDHAYRTPADAPPLIDLYVLFSSRSPSRMTPDQPPNVGARCSVPRGLGRVSQRASRFCRISRTLCCSSRLPTYAHTPRTTRLPFVPLCHSFTNAIRSSISMNGRPFTERRIWNKWPTPIP